MIYRISEFLKNQKLKTIRIHIPEDFNEYDFEMIAEKIYPYTSLKERIRKLFIDLAVQYNKMMEFKGKGLEYEKYEGNKKDVQFEAWEKGVHFLIAFGKKYYCPCFFGENCVMK
jgi:hypothetical protein